MTAVQPVTRPVPAISDDFITLQGRIRLAFCETPELRLTLRQACRLFDVEPGRCARALVRLVYDGHLSTADGCFTRVSAPR